MRKSLPYCLIDGFLQGCIFTLLTEYLTSLFFNKTFYTDILVIAVLLFSSLLSTVILINKHCAAFWKGCLISGIAFVFTILIYFVNLFTLKIRLFPIRELSNADGILIFYGIIGFILFLSASRLIIMLIHTVKKHRSKLNINKTVL